MVISRKFHGWLLFLATIHAFVAGGAVELTDFQEPHPWNQRRWYVNSGTFVDGEWIPDFAMHPHGDLLNSIDIPVSPIRFILEIEANAESAGAQLSIWTVSGAWVSKDVGTISAPTNGAQTIRQVFEIDADLSKDWKWVSNGKQISPKWKRMPRPSRFLGFHMFKGGCKVSKPKIRFVSFRVEGWPEDSAPAIRVMPPSGGEPPRQIAIHAINASMNALPTGTLEVVVEDWDGHRIGKASTSIVDLRGGESRFVQLEAPTYPSGKNYFRYHATWMEDDIQKVGVPPSETSWTRPITYEGTRDHCPELPWGMNLVLSRNQALDRFNGYDPEFTEEAYARMLQKAELARKAGIKWDRFEISPRDLRPTRDEWNWELYDRLVTALSTNGISGFGLVCGFPKWVKPYTEESYVAYCDTLKAIVRRYRGRVHGWEIWNEPNIHFWTGPEDDYFKLVDRAYATIRQVDDKVEVIGLSAASMPDMQQFVERFAKSGARHTGMSVHTYRERFNEGEFLADLKRMSETDGGRRLWISEMGWTTGGRAMQRADEHRQASCLARVSLATAGSPHAAVMNWYDFVDDGFNFNYSEENFGVLRRDLTPKPSYRALSEIGNRFTKGKPELRKVPLAKDYAIWIFNMGGSGAVWTDCDTPRNVVVTTADNTSAFNLMGERIATSQKEFLLSLDGEHPVLFDGTIVDAEVVQRQVSAGEFRMDFDFSDGKTNGVEHRLEPEKSTDLAWAKSVTFEADAPEGVKLMVQVQDASGQGVVVDLPVLSPGRHRYTADFTRCTRHWFGADDGFPHYPLSYLRFHVEALRRNVKGGPFGSVIFSDPTFAVWTESERACLPGKIEQDCAPIVLSTFDEPSSWNPRRWKPHGCEFTNGVVTVDFAAHQNAEIVTGFHIPIVPRKFLLTVEAPAEAAGTRFGLMPTWNTGGTLHGIFGRLAKPADGATTIRQTLELTGDMTNTIWSGAGGSAKFNRKVLPYPSRVWGITIAKGDAPRKTFPFRLVSLEAIGPAGRARPYVRALPPKGDVAPRRLSVLLVNGQAETISQPLLVAISDWEGASVAKASTVVADLLSGETRRVEIELPELPSDRNYFRFNVQAGLMATETSWTRPLEGEGSCELRPDLPWGMNVCVYRNANPTCFGHAAADEDASPEGWRRMEERAGLARACGVKWDRMEVSVKRIRPDRDTWDWTFTDRMVDILTRNGISIYGDVMWFPRWTEGFTGSAYGEYFQVVREAAKRYRGRIRGWEIWNEPNIHYWRGQKTEYFNLITQSYYRIREEDPDAAVIALSLCGADLGYVKEFTGRWWERFTDISFHPYRAVPDESLFLKDLYRMSAAGNSRPLWLSEIGWATGGMAMQTCSEHEQASRLVRMYLTAAGSRCVRVINGYDFVDDGFNSDYSEDSFGVLRRDLSPKPAFRALGLLFRTLTSGKGSLERHVLRAGSLLWIFRMGNHAVVWTDSVDRTRVRLQAPIGVEVTNLMGERLLTVQDKCELDLDADHPVVFSDRTLELDNDL